MSVLRGLSLSVVVPAYNEESRISRAIHAVHGYLTTHGANFEIIVVDDGSTDRTTEIVSNLQRIFASVKLVRLGHNFGKGRAVSKGMLRAEGAFILFTDADQSTSIDQLPHLLVAMQEWGCQVAIGSRSASGAILIRRQAWYREALGKAFGCLMRAILVRGMKDSQCGFKCFTREAARQIFLEVTCQNALFDMEVLLLAARRGYRVAEVPVCWIHDPDSHLVYSVGQSLRLLREFFRICYHYGVGWPVKLDVIRPALTPALTYQDQNQLVREVDHYGERK